MDKELDMDWEKALGSLMTLSGKEVVIMDDLRAKYPERFIKSGQMDWKWFESTIRPNHHIYVRKDKKSLSFTMGGGKCDEYTLMHAAFVLLYRRFHEKEISVDDPREKFLDELYEFVEKIRDMVRK